MPRSLWIPATLLGLGAGVIGFLSLRKGAGVEACATCEAVTVRESDLAKVIPAKAPRRKPPPPESETPCGPPPIALQSDDAPDFSGIGIELVRTRRLIKLPSREEKVTPEELQTRIGQQMTDCFPEGYGVKEGRALAALGAIPEPVDTLAQRAAWWAKTLGAWYDSETKVMLLAHDDRDAGAPEHALGQSFAFLLRERIEWLKKDSATPSTDAWLARASLLAGDAALTALIHASLPASRRAHRGQVVLDRPTADPARHYLQDLELVTFNTGENFAKALHHLGDFDQLDAAYDRPPESTAELLDAALYFSEEQFEPTVPAWKDLKVSGQEPFWDDTLGELGLSTFLWQQVPQKLAQDGVAGWTGDRWLAYEAANGGRGHIVWQTYWKDKPAADKFFAVMQQFLRVKYPEAPPAGETQEPWKWSATGRSVILARTDGGRGMVYVDAGTPDFADALWKKFAAH